MNVADRFNTLISLVQTIAATNRRRLVPPNPCVTAVISRDISVAIVLTVTEDQLSGKMLPKRVERI